MTRINEQRPTQVFALQMENCSQHQQALIKHAEARTIPQLFRKRVLQSPESIAYSVFDEAAGWWVDLTWADMSLRVDAYRHAFANAKLDRGDRVGVLLRNGPDWVGFDIAAMSQGLVTVPLYLHESSEAIAAVIVDSGCRLLLVDTAKHWNDLAEFLGAASQLETVWLSEAPGKSGASEAELPIRTVVAHLKLRTGLAEEPLADAPSTPDELATIIYTSGTTGNPKGVMLSHKAILWNAEAVTQFIAPLPTDIFLSLLPLAHAFERTLGYYLPMMAGATVAYARSPNTLVDDFAAIRPTVFLGVPRLYERIAARVKENAAANPLGRWLLGMTVSLGWRRFESERGRSSKLSWLEEWIWKVLDGLVAARVRAAFGGRIRVAVSGGAALDLSTSRFLCGLGLPLVEGYGLTEAAPVVTATTFEDSLPGSSGQSLHGVEVRIGPRDELLVRSPSMMLGYWQNTTATAQVLDKDGWLSTGDIAKIIDGRIFIKGRLKDLLVMSTGENVSASNVEAAITADPLFEQACVVGDGRPCLLAVVVPKPERWREFAAANDFPPDDPMSSVARSSAVARIQADTARLSKPSQVRGVIVELQPWTTDNMVLTPTLKVKRRVVEERYAGEIAAVYAALEHSHKD